MNNSGHTENEVPDEIAEKADSNRTPISTKYVLRYRSIRRFEYYLPRITIAGGVISIVIAISYAIANRYNDSYLISFSNIFVPLIIAIGVMYFFARTYLDFSKYEMGLPDFKLTSLQSTYREWRNFEDVTISDSHTSIRTELDCQDVFDNFRSRLMQDGRRLAVLSIRNLLIGIAFSFAALIFISYPLFFGTAPGDAFEWATMYYLPRLGIGILLQFVGFFFLRLYVSNEYDIKFNKNEITNMDAKVLAYLMAKDSNTNLIEPVIRSLSATERNFILKKGERVLQVSADDKYNDTAALLGSLTDSISRLSDRRSTSVEPDASRAGMGTGFPPKQGQQ